MKMKRMKIKAEINIKIRNSDKSIIKYKMKKNMKLL